MTYNLLLFPAQKQTFSFAQGFLTAKVSRRMMIPEDPKTRKGQVPLKYTQMPLEKIPAVVTNKAYFIPLRPTELMQSCCFLHNTGKMPPPPCTVRTKLTC